MNNLSGISFVIARHREEIFQRCISFLGARGVEDVCAIRGASSIYEAYDLGWQKAKNDIICFLHEDTELVTLEEQFVYNQFLNPQTGFLGVAGTRILESDGVWWSTDEHKHADSQSGICGQFDPNGKRVKLIFGPHGEVVALDGVCLFTHKRVLEKIGGFCDAPLSGFHYYDISACIRARLAGFKNYTIPMDLYHLSGGETNEAWERNRQIFLKKYGSHLPMSLDNILLTKAS